MKLKQKVSQKHKLNNPAHSSGFHISPSGSADQAKRQSFEDLLKSHLKTVLLSVACPFSLYQMQLSFHQYQSDAHHRMEATFFVTTTSVRGVGLIQPQQPYPWFILQQHGLQAPKDYIDACAIHYF